MRTFQCTSKPVCLTWPPRKEKEEEWGQCVYVLPSFPHTIKLHVGGWLRAEEGSWVTLQEFLIFLAMAESVHAFARSHTARLHIQMISNKHLLIYITSSEFILSGKLEIWRTSPLLVHCGETRQSVIFLPCCFFFFSNCKINREKGRAADDNSLEPLPGDGLKDFLCYLLFLVNFIWLIVV